MKIEKNDIKKTIENLTNDLAESGYPSFVAVYVPGSGYQYSAILPEEININISSTETKFNEFLKTVIGFNKEDYKI